MSTNDTAIKTYRTVEVERSCGHYSTVSYDPAEVSADQWERIVDGYNATPCSRPCMLAPVRF